MSKQVRTFVLLVAGAALASCGGEAPPTGPRGGGQPQMNRIIKASPSFEQDIQEIFVRAGCTEFGCHASGQGDVTLHPDDRANYGRIVNRASAISCVSFPVMSSLAFIVALPVGTRTVERDHPEPLPVRS